MPTIRIDDEVWQELQSLAKPFVDTPNDVLRRVFQLDTPQLGEESTLEKKTSMKSRGAKRIGATPQHEYRIPIAKSLLEMKGAGETNKVLDAVYVKMKNKLMPVDLELKDKTGEARWRLQARWERKNMALDGLLKADSPYGVWELTPKGAALVS